MPEASESPEVWTVTAEYANRRPAELRRFCDRGGWVRVVETSRAEPPVYWMSAQPPAFLGESLADDLPALVAMLHRQRSAARREACNRRVRAAGREAVSG